MADAPTRFPVGVLANVTEIISANAQTMVLARIDTVLTYIPDVTRGGNGGQGVANLHPDFDEIPPATAQKLRDLLTALKTAVDAAPVA